MRLVKITEREIIDETGEQAKRDYDCIDKKLPLYARKRSSDNPNEQIYSVPSMPGMEIRVHYEMEGEVSIPGDKEIIGQGSRRKIIFHGTPHLIVRLGYLENTSERDIEEIKNLLSGKSE